MALAGGGGARHKAAPSTRQRSVSVGPTNKVGPFLVDTNTKEEMRRHIDETRPFM